MNRYQEREQENRMDQSNNISEWICQYLQVTASIASRKEKAPLQKLSFAKNTWS